MLGTLYIMATPIGNLDDITLRALSALKEVSWIFCEDTRVTKKLLNHFDIKTPVDSFHQHSERAKSIKILDILKSGQNIALVCDAGTPGISDPGAELVSFVRNNLPEAAITPIPGVSAVATVLSVSGFPTDKFIFFGFPPHKNKRQKFWQEVARAPYTAVFYESCHRIKKALGELTGVLPEDARIFIGRELTKKFESFYYGKIKDVADKEIPEKGEFVIVVKVHNS